MPDEPRPGTPSPARPVANPDTLAHVCGTTLGGLALIYLLTASGFVANADASVMLALTRSLLAGKLDLPASAGGVEGPDGLFYCHFGLLTSVLWAPLVWVGGWLAELAPRIPRDRWEEFLVGFANIPVMIALLGYLALAWQRRRVPAARLRQGLWIAGLGTMLWPYAKLPLSDPLMTLGIFAAYVHWRDSQSGRDDVLAGIWLGLALLARKQAEPIILVLVAFLALMAQERRGRRLGLLLAGFLPGLCVQLLYNHARWGGFLVERYAGVGPWTFPGWGTVALRIHGLLLGLDHGFLPYNLGCVALAIGALAVWWRADRRETGLVLALMGSQALFLAQFPFWEGGVSLGSRFFLFLAPFVALAWAHMPDRTSDRLRWIRNGALAAGILVQVGGVATDPLAANLRRELCPHEFAVRHAGLMGAGAGELMRVTKLSPPAPVPDSPLARTYLQHPTFQTLNFWWLHAWRQGTTSSAPPPPARPEP